MSWGGGTNCNKTNLNVFEGRCLLQLLKGVKNVTFSFIGLYKATKAKINKGMLLKLLDVAENLNVRDFLVL